MEAVRLMAEQRRGLAKVLKLYPHEMQAAAERGLKPLGAAPKGTTSIDRIACAYFQRRAISSASG